MLFHFTASLESLCSKNPRLPSKMEKETEAMAAQFSSLDVVDDIFSKLPEHIIHCILGLLPSIKDVVRTSAISKTWLHAWRTFPIPEFNFEDFVSRSRPQDYDAKSKNFIGFIDNTLRRFEKQNGDGIMKIFDLTTVNKMSDHTNRWVGKAVLDNEVEHLALNIFMDGTVLPCLIPDRVLSAHWLKSLILVGPTICMPLSESSCRVNLPLLTSLHVRYSSIVDEELQKLLSGCPALENIALLDCERLSKVEILKHPNLESLEVTVSSTEADLTSIRVKAPKLKSFGYTCECLYKRNVFVKVYNSPELRRLRISDWNKTDEWFNKFTAQFPLIETLTLDWCNALRKIRISNPLLESINLLNCNNLEDVVISCKKLESFYLFTLQSSIPKPSIRMDMENPPTDCSTQIIAPMKCNHMMEARWYCNLKDFLTRPFSFRSVSIVVQALEATDGDMMGKNVHKKLPSAAVKIEKLRLGVVSPSLCYPHILNGVLSACHPTTLKLAVTSGNSFVKLVCEELGNKGTNRKCCCKGKFKCWKHQLKEVKIEKIKGIKLEGDLDWDALFSMLPTLEAGNDISFKLKW